LKKIILFTIISALIVTVLTTTISAQSQYEIPSWVKGIAGFWAEDKISDNEFGEGLAFLIDSEIIKVPIIQELESKINQIQSENNRLKGQVSSLKSQNADLQNKLNEQSVTTVPNTSSKITTNSQSDLNYPKLTKRIDGETARSTLLSFLEFYESLSRFEQNKLLNHPVSQSQFTVGIAYGGNWILTAMEGNFEMVQYSGSGVSAIPYDCSRNPDYIYSIVGQKEDESGKITVFLFKNGIMIDTETSEKPYGTVAMASVCDEPSVAN